MLTMNESGITSQYGFLFQRKVFVLYVLENMNVKQRFCFEGKDDVEIAADEKIYELPRIGNKTIRLIYPRGYEIIFPEGILIND